MTKKPMKYPNAQSRYEFLMTQVDKMNGALSSGCIVVDSDDQRLKPDSRFVTFHEDYIVYIGIAHPLHETVHLCGLQYRKGTGNIRHPTIHLFDGYRIWNGYEDMGAPK